MSVHINKKNLSIYLLSLILSIVFASFYGGAVSFVPLYSLLLLIPVSIFYIFINYKFLRVYQEIEVHRIVKGENHRFRATIENAGILPITGMKLGLYKDRCDLFDISDGQEISLRIHEKKELTSAINCRFAGAYEVGIESVSLADPFLIFQVCLNIPYHFRAVVSPRITNIADSVLDLENTYNSTGFKSNDFYESIPGSDLRAYQPGDQLSAINWKISAKLSELVVRIPDRLENRIVTILLEAVNATERMQNIDFLKKRDAFLEFGISAAWHFAGQGVPVKIIYPSGKVQESIIDSYDSFLEFYGIAADGIFYSNTDVEKEMHLLAQNRRSSRNDRDTWIIIREDPGKGEENLYICE